MDAGRRRALHRRIAGIIEEIYGDDIETNKAIKDSYNLHKQIGLGLIDAVKSTIDQKQNQAAMTQLLLKLILLFEAAITEIQYCKKIAMSNMPWTNVTIL